VIVATDEVIAASDEVLCPSGESRVGQMRWFRGTKSSVLGGLRGALSAGFTARSLTFTRPRSATDLAGA
jgi:hypothetical protein